MIERKFNPTTSHSKLRLHSSERNTPFGKLFEKYKKSLTETDIRYYPNTEELHKPISQFYGYDNFLMGFGSDRCIKYFLEAHIKKHWFCGKKRLLISEPSFPMYDIYGQMFDYKIKKVEYDAINFPILQFLDEVDTNSIIVISNPSSPIGDVISRENIIKILDIGYPTLIDEAYIEFSNEKSCIDLIDEYPNLFVTRTISKAYGSAGTRFGCIFSQKQNIQKLNQYRDMYETTCQTLKWIKTLVDNKPIFDEYITSVKKTRKDLCDRLDKNSIPFIPSESNWIHIRKTYIKNIPKNILIKQDCSIPGQGNDWVRLQITDNLNDYLWI